MLEEDFTGITPQKITEQSVQLVRGADEDGLIIVPILRGVLPVEANRVEVDVSKIKSAAEKALLVHPVILLRENEVSEEVLRSIFESELKDLKTKAFEYFSQIFSERYNHEEADRIARMAVNLIDPLTKKQDDKVKQTIEELIQ